VGGAVVDHLFFSFRYVDQFRSYLSSNSKVVRLKHKNFRNYRSGLPNKNYTISRKAVSSVRVYIVPRKLVPRQPADCAGGNDL